MPRPETQQIQAETRVWKGLVMATVKEIKATARPQAGKGAARSERRAGKVPGVIYGDSKPPLTISLDYADLRQKIYAGRFLTTVYDLELEGQKHRVIPRDFQLDPVRDNPLHVDFMRIGEGATIRVAIPVHVINADKAPGVKRGGTINMVTHTIDVMVKPEQIPDHIEVDVAELEINYSRHLSDIKFPEGVKPVARVDLTLVTIVPPSGYAEELRQAAEAAAAAATAAAAAAEAGAAPAAEGAAAPAPGAAPAGGAAPAAGAAPAGGGAAPKK
jgi:large subunit ribosomal protein L25